MLSCVVCTDSIISAVALVADMKMAQYVSGMFRHLACPICTRYPRRTYLARKPCLRSRLLVTWTATTNGHHSEECVSIAMFIIEHALCSDHRVHYSDASVI